MSYSSPAALGFQDRRRLWKVDHGGGNCGGDGGVVLRCAEDVPGSSR